MLPLSSRNRQDRRRASRRWRRILGTAVAGLLPGTSAGAVAFNEPPDLGNTFATRTQMPAGVDAVNGTVGNDPPAPGEYAVADPFDFFRISGSPGDNFEFTASLISGPSSGFLLHFLNESGQFLNFAGDSAADGQYLPANPQTLFGSPGDSFDVVGVMPSDGFLTVRISAPEPAPGQYIGVGALGFTTSFAVPEAAGGALAAVGAALGALVARLRRRKS